MWSYEFYLKCWYVRKLGTTAWAVIETNPECLQLSEQPALRVGRGNRPWFKPSDAFLWWDHEFHGQPSLRTPHCTRGSCVKPTGNFVECQSLLSFFLCAHKSLGRRMLCGSVGPDVFIPFLLTLVCPLTLLPLPSFPCVTLFACAQNKSSEN